jgi:hypothetical protein
MAREVRRIGGDYAVKHKCKTFHQAARWLTACQKHLDPKFEYGIFRVERHGKRVEVELETTFSVAV